MSGLTLEDLSIGQTAERSHTVTEATIAAFAEVSGDHNPVHLDAAFAATTAFKERIAHGMLSAAYISAVLGNDLATFPDYPAEIGDVVTARVTVAAIDAEKARVTFATVCEVAGKAVVTGEAVIMAPRGSD